MTPILAQWSPEIVTALGLAAGGFVTAVIAAIWSYRKGQAGETRTDNKEVFDQQRAIILDLRRRISALENGRDKIHTDHDALLEKYDELQADHDKCEKDREVQKTEIDTQAVRTDKLENDLKKLTMLYINCSVPGCPMATALKGNVKT